MAFPAISSNTLFHFVDKREYLIEILEHEFKPRFCKELTSDAMPTKDTWWDRVIPMKCFCDLPLSSLGPHLKTYGEFGIGMTKEWGRRKGITPVLYVHADSLLIECVKSSVGSQTHSLLSSDAVVHKLAREFGELINFTKPYVGSFERGGVLYENVRFYDEREWRYVPKNCTVFEPSHFNDKALMEAENNKIGAFPIPFGPDDVRYIIVPSETDILQMHQDIEYIKGRSGKFTSAQIHILQTRIISADQIRDDF